MQTGGQRYFLEVTSLSSNNGLSFLTRIISSAIASSLRLPKVPRGNYPPAETCGVVLASGNGRLELRRVAPAPVLIRLASRCLVCQTNL